jgi:membrane protein implicated in regulation of membrane protease activity
MVGVAAGAIIGALGLLLLGIDAPPSSGRSIAGVLFKVSGSFFLFVSVMAFLGAYLSFRNRRNRPGGDPGRQERRADR